MDDHSLATINFAKTELNRLSNGIRANKVEMTELFHSVMFSDVLRVTRGLGSARQQLEHVHTEESKNLTEAIRDAQQFSEAQKSLMLLNLAVYTKDVGTLLDSFAHMSTQLKLKLEQIELSEDTPDSLIFEQVNAAEQDADLSKLETLFSHMNQSFKLKSAIEFPRYEIASTQPYYKHNSH